METAPTSQRANDAPLWWLISHCQAGPVLVRELVNTEGYTGFAGKENRLGLRGRSFSSPLRLLVILLKTKGSQSLGDRRRCTISSDRVGEQSSELCSRAPAVSKK